MLNNDFAQEGMNVAPSKQERTAGVLMYLFGYFGEFGLDLFFAFGLIQSLTDLPYFVRFHWSQAGRNSILAFPIVLFIVTPALIDSFVFKISNTVMYSSFVIAGLFALWLVIIDIYAMICAARGEMKQVLPGTMKVRAK